MSQRAYVFDRSARERIAAVKRVAENVFNWYIAGHSDQEPGDRPQHVFEIGGVKCVFSITLYKGIAGWQHYRHASFSLPQPSGEKTPNPIAIFTIAHLLGLTGGEIAPTEEDADVPTVLSPARDWQVGVQDGGVVVVAQLLDPSSMPLGD